MNFEDLKSIDFDSDSEEPVEEAESETQPQTDSRSYYENYSKSIALTFGYLLGVEDEYMTHIPNEPEEYEKLKAELERNSAAKAVRHLNNIRSKILLNFKNISRTSNIMSSEFTPVYKIDMLKDDFKALEKLDIKIITGRSDLEEYLEVINNEIKKHIHELKPLFPEWVNFKHISAALISPNKSESGKQFSANRTYYPYQKYMNWKKPFDYGNILAADIKLLEVLYESDGDKFTERSKVVDASVTVKDNINEFLEYGTKIQIFVDGENTNPYRLSAAMESLTDEEAAKIEKIVVYYDDKYSTRAWLMLTHFVNGITTECVSVSRLKEEKSLVDHKLVAGVSKAVYQDHVDSIILCSSDSDFWAVIEDIKAKYLVMAETDKCGYDFKEVLRENNIFYCYLDRFMVPSDNPYPKMVLRRTFQQKLDAFFETNGINFKELFEDALAESRVELSEQEIENVYSAFCNSTKVIFDKDDNLSLELQK